MDLEPDIELTREMVRLEVERSSLRLVAKEVGISHVALRDFIAEGSKRQPYGAGRRKLLEWAARHEKFEPPKNGLDYYRGMRDALSGMVEYIDKRREELRDFYQMVRLDKELDDAGPPPGSSLSRPLPGDDDGLPTTPSIERAEAEAEVFRRLPALPPLEKKKGKRRA